MKLENALRLTAGIVIALVTTIGILIKKVDIYFSIIYFFISLNLIQSAFTNWCPIKTFYEKILKLK
jgi:hypothetical protein